MQIEVSSETILLLVEFKIFGDLRYLSHAERVTMFQRCFVRAELDIKYSQGFNPRPKLSLPLPGTVGVESYGDIACIQINSKKHLPDTIKLKNRIISQMPDGCDITNIYISADRKVPISQQVTYEFDLKSDLVKNQKLLSDISDLLDKDYVLVQRKAKKGGIKEIDIREYLIDIELKNYCITVNSRITPKGSVRVDEIMQALGIDFNLLKSPIRRTNIKWKFQKAG